MYIENILILRQYITLWRLWRRFFWYTTEEGNGLLPCLTHSLYRYTKPASHFVFWDMCVYKRVRVCGEVSCVCVRACVRACMRVCARACACLCVCLSICPSVCLSICVSVGLFVYLSVYLSIFSLCLSSVFYACVRACTCDKNPDRCTILNKHRSETNVWRHVFRHSFPIGVWFISCIGWDSCHNCETVGSWCFTSLRKGRYLSFRILTRVVADLGVGIFYYIRVSRPLGTVLTLDSCAGWTSQRINQTPPSLALPGTWTHRFSHFWRS